MTSKDLQYFAVTALVAGVTALTLVPLGRATHTLAWCTMGPDNDRPVTCIKQKLNEWAFYTPEQKLQRALGDPDWRDR